MRPKQKSFKRNFSQRTKINFFKPERARVRAAIANCDFDVLPHHEGMYAHQWRGDDAYGDNTRRGHCLSRTVDSHVIERVIRSFVGRTWEDLYTYVSGNFHGKDLEAVKNEIYHDFARDQFRFGHKQDPAYVIENCVIVAIEKKTIRQLRRSRKESEPQMVCCLYLSETKAYVAHDCLWYRAELADREAFVTWRLVDFDSLYRKKMYTKDACGVSVSGKSWLAGYHTEFHRDFVEGDVRYNDKWVLHRHSVNARELEEIQKRLL